MHVDEKSFANPRSSRGRRRRARVGGVTPVYNEESVAHLFLPSVLDRKMSAGHMDYMPGRLMGEGLISHLSCLRDKTVCLTSHINNVMGPNLPGLWRSHGSPLIPFDWEMTFIVGRSEMTSPWQIADRAKRSDNPTPHHLTPPRSLFLHLLYRILAPVCFVCATSFSKRKSAAVLSRHWIR